MKAIINNKIYDTETAELIKTYYKHYELTGKNIFGYTSTFKKIREIELYKTKKGNWFEVMKKIEGVTNSTIELEVVSELEVKETFKDLGDAVNYMKYFDKLEEA